MAQTPKPLAWISVSTGPRLEDPFGDYLYKNQINRAKQEEETPMITLLDLLVILFFGPQSYTLDCWTFNVSLMAYIDQQIGCAFGQSHSSNLY